jgi:hypothetical protein
MISRQSIICNAQNNRSKKHSNIRKKANENRRISDKNVRSTIGTLAKQERTRLDSLWESHKEFFSGNTETEENKVTEAELVVDNSDLENSNSFFETD